MTSKIRSFLILAIVALAASVNIRADAVSDWNAYGASFAPNRPGPTIPLDLAVMHLAIYDAVQSIEGDYKPYHQYVPGASGSPEAATARAARDVLISRFPSSAAAIDLFYSQYLINNQIDPLDPGIAVGAASAAAIIALRTGDGSFPSPPPPPFFGYIEIGKWRTTSPTGMAVPWLGNVRPFTLKSSSQFRAGPPPALNSPEYTRAYNEVKAMGKKTDSSRTTDETDLAHFWNLGYPVVMPRIVRSIAEAHVNNISDSSRLFALTHTSMSDALITAWDSKNTYVFWRPSTAIREGDNDGNPKTEGDPTWEALLPDPPYPDHTSGANNITAATMRAMSLFFGTNEMTFQITTTNTGPTVNDTRTFYTFNQVMEEVVDGRIWEGIHFRFADEDARFQGRRVAQWAHAHYFRPVD